MDLAGRKLLTPRLNRTDTHEVYEALFKEESPKVVWALFDNRGLLSSTIDHLSWLNISLPLKAVSVYDVAKALGKEAKE